MFRKILIANRGAIACRIHAHPRSAWASPRSRCTPKPMRMRRMCGNADESYCLGPAPAAESYLRADAIIEVARRSRRRGHSSGLRLPVRERRTSPRPARRQASPSSARRRRRCAASASSTARARWRSTTACRCCPAAACCPTSTAALARPRRIGYPVMLKSTAGGGGIGMRLCTDPDELTRAFEAVPRPRDGQLQRWRRVPREVRAQCAAHRGAAVRRWPRRGDRAGRARLLHAAPQPEGASKKRLPRAFRDDAARSAACRRRAARARQCDYRIRRHGGVRLRRGCSSSSTSSRSTRACRSSMASPRKSVGVDLVEWMMRVAAGEPPDLAAHPACAARSCRAGARLCRGSGARLPSLQRPADRCAVCRGPARGCLGRDRHRGHHLVRPDARQADRLGADARRSHRQAGRGAVATPGCTASKPTCPSSPCCSATSSSRPAAPTTALLSTTAVLDTRHRSACSPGTLTTVQDWPGREWLLGRRRSAVGSDGCAFAATGQSHRGQ